MIVFNFAMLDHLMTTRMSPSQMGNVLNKFGCSKHLEFPNGVVVNDRQEIFISDNRAHCVKVFSYEGVYLRQIGAEGESRFNFVLIHTILTDPSSNHESRQIHLEAYM